MAKHTFKVHLDLDNNELQNAVLQNLSAHPSTAGLPQGYFYYNTTADTTYQWTGTVWLDLGAQGTGTVSSVAASITGDAVGISGSPVTTTGTLAFTWAGTTGQYVRGDGTLDTFPTVPTVTPAALTKTDDTNVTLTLGGTPSTALLQATSLTLGWTGVLAIGRGGTGLSTLGTANQLLRVNAGGTALEYFTPTYTSNTGTVTSVGISSTDLSVTSSPITTSGSITLDINNDAVTFAKMQNLNAEVLIGRGSSGTGDPVEITVDSTLKFTGNVLGVDTGSMGGGTVTSVSEGTGMDFTTITTTGTVSIDVNKVPYFAGNLTGTPSSSTFLRGDGNWYQLIDDGTTTLTSTWSSDKIEDYITNLLTSGMDFRGDYNASTNSPNLDSAPSAGTIFKGDVWVVSTAGTFYSEDMEIGDMLFAKIDDPASLTDWVRLNKNIPPIVSANSYSTDFGDGSNTSYTITHNLGSRDVITHIYDSTTYEEVVMEVVHTSTSVVTVSANTPPTSNEFRIVVQRIA